MILPKKHLSLDESILGFGAFLLSQLSENEIFVDDLWKKYQDAYQTKAYPVAFGFDNFILTIDFLFIVGAIHLNNRGGIGLCG